MSITLYRNSLVNSLMRDVFSDSHRGLARETEGPRTLGYPVDVYEDEDILYFEAELPGVKKEDVKVEFNGGHLSISGARTGQREAGKGKFFVSERCTGSFSRCFRIGDGYQNTKIAASFKDGVLSVQIPKKEETKPVSVEIN